MAQHGPARWPAGGPRQRGRSEPRSTLGARSCRLSRAALRSWPSVTRCCHPSVPVGRECCCGGARRADPSAAAWEPSAPHRAPVASRSLPAPSLSWGDPSLCRPHCILLCLLPHGCQGGASLGLVACTSSSSSSSPGCEGKGPTRPEMLKQGFPCCCTSCLPCSQASR